MKTSYKIAAALMGSFVLGVGASSLLHAQARPPAFVWAEVDIKDVVGFNGNFLAQARANIKESGGHYLAGNTEDTPNIVALNGSAPPSRVTLIQFADMDAAKAFFAKERALESDIGSKYANFRVVAIEGN